MDYDEETAPITKADRAWFNRDISQLDEAYEVLTKLIILGGELHNKKLIEACENLQDIIDNL